MQAPLLPTAETTTPPHPADTSSTDRLSEQYDFIIIGGGTAGLVVASRLSENPSVQVLVIEAGANRAQDPMILTPGLGFGLYNNHDYDWDFSTVPQKELNNRIIPHQRGKVLGGSSAIYQMQLLYSSKLSFDSWEKLGNTGWNWGTMLPYLRKFHTQHAPGPTESINEISSISYKDEGVDSTDGPVQTCYSNTDDWDKAWFESWIKIMAELKYEDGLPLGGQAVTNGIDPKTRTRSYAVTAYYSADVSSRPNLRIVTEALVQKILFSNGSDVVASGVRFISKAGRSHDMKSVKEVILSAGSIASPQILEVSGIGDAKLLSSLDIDTILDNPSVGENLQDHILVPVSFEVADGVQTGEVVMRNPEIMGSLIAMYQKNHSGPMGHNFVPFAQFRLPETFAEGGSTFLKSLFKQHGNENAREIDEVTLALIEQATVQQLMVRTQFNISSNTKITQMVVPLTEGNYATFMIALNHPFSRGNIHITSSDIKTAPKIDPKYLSHPMDLELLARHIQFFPTIVTTSPLSNYLKPAGRRIPTYAFPASKTSKTGIEEMDLETAKKLVREQTFSNYHPAGTCSMLPREKGGVVDGRLKVWGVKGLRVVDASVFPVMPRGNIITSVYAVAERAADLIKEDWNLKSL